MPDLADLLSEAVKENPIQEKKQNPEQLKNAFTVFCKRHGFMPGDLVEWKPGMANRTGVGPFIVIEVLSEPVISSNTKSDTDPGSAYFREPLDIICGKFFDGSFLCYHCDSRRFQPYSGE